MDLRDWDACVPDGIEPIVGWRYWRADSAWLGSLNRFKTWPPGNALRARCPLVESHTDPPPGARCGCGIYAAVDLPTLQELTQPDFACALVVGEVALWGRVIPGELGYRAQFAYPRRLWVVRESLPALDWPGELCQLLAQNYRVPVDPCDAAWAVAEDALAACARHPGAAGQAASVSSFKQMVERLAAALDVGDDAYQAELARASADEAARAVTEAFRRSLAGGSEPPAFGVRAW